MLQIFSGGTFSGRRRPGLLGLADLVFFLFYFLGIKMPTDLGNVKILFNDWPYGVEKGISHLVVWTKFPLDTEGERGKLTAPARQMVERFVNGTFRDKVGGDKVRVSPSRIPICD